MTLGALVDLGVPVQTLQDSIASLGLPQVEIKTSEVVKKGFRAIQIHIEHPPEHAHRHLHHIVEMIERGNLSSRAKKLSTEIFTEIGKAEAKVHGTTIEKVHFHEVGAIDSIVDIVGVAVAMDELDIETCYASTIRTGSGSVHIAHGNVSIPAPATLEILKGIPIEAGPIIGELTTPTGAAIIKSQCEQFGPMPPMKVEAIGYGAGSMDLEQQANVLRVSLGQCQSTVDSATDHAHHHHHHESHSEDIVCLQTNLDDTSPQQIADVVDRMIQAGAADAWTSPCVMKKGRLGSEITVLATPSEVSRFESLLFQNTPTLGIRRWTVRRQVLAREEGTVETQWGPVRTKKAILAEGKFRIRAEDDDVRELSRRCDVPAEVIRRETDVSQL